MAEPNHKTQLPPDEARAGQTPHVTRYVLAISLLLVVAIFALLFML